MICSENNIRKISISGIVTYVDSEGVTAYTGMGGMMPGKNGQGGMEPPGGMTPPGIA